MNDSSSRSMLDSRITLLDGRETIATTTLDAEPDAVLHMPQDSRAPIVLALALSVVFFGLLLHGWWSVGAGVLASIVVTIWWLWPDPAGTDKGRA